MMIRMMRCERDDDEDKNQHVQDYENKDEHGEDDDVTGYSNSIDFVGLINIKK